MKGVGAAVLVLALSVICAYGAAPKKRLWKMVPGYPTVFVDINSIVTQEVKYVPPRDAFHGPALPIDTEVDVRLNGKIAVSWLNCVPVPWVTMEASEATRFEIDGRLIGYVPDKAIKTMICPIRKRLQP